MAEDEKPVPRDTDNGSLGRINESERSKGTLIKGHIPDFKYTSEPPSRPNSNPTDSTDKK